MMLAIFELNCSNKQRKESQQNIIPEPTARIAVPGVSPGRGLVILHLRSSKSLLMGEGNKILALGTS